MLFSLINAFKISEFIANCSKNEKQQEMSAMQFR